MSRSVIPTWVRVLVLAAVLLSGRGAAGDDGAARGKDPERLEVGGLPALNYDSDRGLGLGAVVNLARFDPAYEPYRWRLRLVLYATLKQAPGGGTEIGVHDDQIKLDLPGLAGGWLRLRSIVGFRRFTTSGYYGLGNASRAETPWEEIDPDLDPDGYRVARRFHQYDRIYPYGRFYGSFALWDDSAPARRRRLDGFAGFGFAYNIVNLYQDSLLEQQARLAQDSSEDGQTLARLLHGTDDHALLQLTAGLLWDSRDHEYVPTRGTFVELSVRGSPGVEDDLYFAGMTLNARHFWPLYGEHLVLASRALGDLLFGNPPVYELAHFGSFDQADGPGGGWSVRGVPRYRFHGKVKMIGNLELRGRFLPFQIGNNQFHLGANLFLDAGRVWADYRDAALGGAALDGELVDFAVGAGAGLRLQWGETFVIRADPAWSPTERTFGFYIDIGHIY